MLFYRICEQMNTLQSNPTQIYTMPVYIRLKTHAFSAYELSTTLESTHICVDSVVEILKK